MPGPVEISLSGASVPLISASRDPKPYEGGFIALVEMPPIARWNRRRGP